MPHAAVRANRRTLSRERRRQQLIDATIKCISKKGLSSVTLGDVAREAGLSQGIVNLHFNSKENLLTETLRFLAEDYDAQFMKVMSSSPADPAATLLALMEMDLTTPVCDRSKLAVWFAFWGEVKAVRTYQKICTARDQKYEDIMHELVAAIVREGDYADIDVDAVAATLSSLTDGMWLSFLINPKTFDRTKALDGIKSYLRAIFPEHYQ